MRDYTVYSTYNFNHRKKIHHDPGANLLAILERIGSEKIQLQPAQANFRFWGENKLLEPIPRKQLLQKQE